MTVAERVPVRVFDMMNQVQVDTSMIRSGLDGQDSTHVPKAFYDTDPPIKGSSAEYSGSQGISYQDKTLEWLAASTAVGVVAAAALAFVVLSRRRHRGRI